MGSVARVGQADVRAISPVVIDILRDDRRGSDDRRLHPAAVRQGNHWPARNGHRGCPRAEKGVIGRRGRNPSNALTQMDVVVSLYK